jgi:ribonuclease HI
MFFDGASSSMGAGARVVFKSPSHETISLSYKLEFEVTNNVAEYEALVLGLRAAKEMGIKEIAVFGDAELIVQQVKNVYQTKHPRLNNYRNEVWDLVDSFFLDFNISFIPREENAPVDFLAFSASLFEVPALSTVFKDKFVSADTDQSPQIHLDLEQTVTEYYSFPSSKVLNGQEKKDEVLTLGKLSLSLLILALPQCSCVVQSQQHKPITAKTLIYSKL